MEAACASKLLIVVLMLSVVPCTVALCPANCFSCTTDSNVCDAGGCSPTYYESSGSCVECFVEPGWLYDAPVASTTTTSSQSTCCKMCELDTSCDKWAFRPADGRCTLMNGATNSRTQNSGHVSGLPPKARPCTHQPPQCATNYACWENWVWGSLLPGCVKIVTRSPTPTRTPTRSATTTRSVTLTQLPTSTHSGTSTPSASQSQTRSPTATRTTTITRSATQTCTRTPTTSLTSTAAVTFTFTSSRSRTPTASLTFTETRTLR
eukprot:NODE_5347_length_954_cov_82.507822_g5131_i0.p1 GENE.NODE_5347_length_954_cov_82.507822_g5131_i0~~NODE_5347_length_954_cov_82.507822_g5131_i0.p1  ORF type:complete len:264 (-),score=23.85 NODE_5347_length_954_cov_82.507822_g5131_i0:5-796(-)